MEASRIPDVDGLTLGMPFLLETPTVEACARLCGELGLSFVELNMNFPPCQAGRLDPALLLRLKREEHIFFTLHLPEDANPFSFEPEIARAWRGVIRDALLLAQAVGAPIVNMHLPHGVYLTLPDRRTYLAASYPEEMMDSAHQLRSLAEELLSGTDTRLTVENTDGWMPHEQALIDYLLESPVFGLTLDIGHSHAAGDADMPFILRHQEKLCHMHGHDAVGKRNHLALGDGEIDLAERFALARRVKARIVLETKTVAALRQSLAWLDCREDTPQA